MTENITATIAPTAPEGVPEWSPKISQGPAMLALGITRERLFALKLRRRKIGSTTFYDPEQITALMQLRDHWRKTAPR